MLDRLERVVARFERAVSVLASTTPDFPDSSGVLFAVPKVNDRPNVLGGRQ